MPAPRTLAGVDGCPVGWVCVTEQPGQPLAVHVHSSARSLFAEPTDLLCIDIPIGLVDSGERACDAAARAVLGPRKSSVFSAPLRALLESPSQREATRLRREIEGKGVSAQSFNIYAKIREVDACLCANAALPPRVREVHPEVCFWAMNSDKPMSAPKRTAAGLAERRALLDREFGGPAVRRAFDDLRASHGRTAVTDDDLHDALAALWTARRLARGRARTLPHPVPTDALGLRMEMCC